jgi:hypothetical protein
MPTDTVYTHACDVELAKQNVLCRLWYISFAAWTEDGYNSKKVVLFKLN